MKYNNIMSIYNKIIDYLVNRRVLNESEKSYWDVKSLKDRFIILFEKESKDSEEIVYFIININSPFMYYSNCLETNSTKINELSKDVITNYRALQIIGHLLSSRYLSFNDFDVSLFDYISNKIKDFSKHENISPENEEKILRTWNSFNEVQYSEISDYLAEWEKRTSEQNLTINEYENNNTNSAMYFSIGYFPNSHKGESNLSISRKHIKKINNEISNGIIAIAKNNLTEVNLCKIYPNSKIIAIENIQGIDRINKRQIRNALEIESMTEKKGIIKNLLTKITDHTNDDGGINILVEENKFDFEAILSPENYEWLIKSGKRQKEMILNKILEDNVWLFGYESKDVIQKNVFSQKEKNTWKPDLVVKRPDGNMEIYELKLSNELVFGWDNSHKSHYTKSNLNKAISQIESQHQYLLLSNNDTLTKNDTLYIVISNYAREIDNITPAEITKFGSKQRAMTNKIKNIKLLRNKYKNAKIIFYDELNLN